ncbi:MAG TPA: class I SAM-dependent methyltransferase [Coleofasciculaceae cyanobacterium]
MSSQSFGLTSYTDERIHCRVIQLLENRERGMLLDIGAGTGALSKKLQELGFSVSACDLHCDNFIPKEIPFKVANLNDALPYDNASFDVVVGTEIIEHLENPWHLVRELHRVTKPGGTIVLSTPNLDNWYVRLIFFLTGKLYNFLSSYEAIGHITPVFLWNLRRMCEGKFDIEQVLTTETKIPGLGLWLPLRGFFWGQCFVAQLQRVQETDVKPRTWYGNTEE